MSLSEEEGRAAERGSGAPGDDVLGKGSIGDNASAASISSGKPSFNPEALEDYRDTGHELIPLVGIGKAPGKGWPSCAALSPELAKEQMLMGQNVGVRLRATDLVVDVDPRNFAMGDNPLARLGEQLGIDWTAFPTVITGSGGRHIYMSKPDGVSLRETVSGFEGIEFKSFGRQVVAAGSVHPNTRKPYIWDDDPLAVPLRSISAAPVSLIEFAIRSDSSCIAVEGGDRSPEQLASWLDALDPCDFADYDRWLEITMACHHATGGAGREEFIAWSIGDARYSDHAELIGRHWDSLRSDGGRKVTERTLFKRLIEAGRQDLLPRVSARDDFPDDLLETECPPTEAKPRRRGVVDEWVYVIDAEMFVRRSDGKKWKKEQWKARFAALKPDGDVLNAIWKGTIPLRKFEALVYLPGDPEFPDGEEGGRYNIWRESGTEAKAGDVAPFLDHMELLFPDDAERGYVLDYLAMLIQEPGRKVNYALLVKGDQGTGKSWIGRLMARIIGQPNMVFPSNSEVMSNWTAWTEGAQLAVIEELMAMGRLEMANKLKPIITEPFLRIEAKNCNLYSIPNRLNLIAFTNHEDAVPIERGDRRWLVVFSNAGPRDAGYYDRLFAFLDGDGPAAVKDWLLKRRVTLNPKGMAPATEGKAVMRRLSLGEAEQFLTEQMEDGASPFTFDLFRFEDVMASVPPDITRRTRGLRDRVTRWLRESAGAVKHSRYTKSDNSGRTSSPLWSLRNHAEWEAAGAAARADAFAQQQTHEQP